MISVTDGRTETADRATGARREGARSRSLVSHGHDGVAFAVVAAVQGRRTISADSHAVALSGLEIAGLTGITWVFVLPSFGNSIR